MKNVSSNNLTLAKTLANTPTYKAGVVQSAAFRLLNKFVEECVQEYGLTTMQWFIIGTIYEAGETGIGVTALGRAVDTNVPYITNTLNLLEHKDIIYREAREGDNRAKVVKITPTYLKNVPVIEATLRKKMKEVIYANISAAELHTYITVLYKLNQSLATRS